MRRVLIMSALMTGAVAVSACQGSDDQGPGPEPAPPVFASVDKNITFPTPPGSIYCRLPDDWIGSDHGVNLYLTPPATCGGAGYPSSSRGATATASAISVFYGYDVVDADLKAPAESCLSIGSVMLLGRMTPLCEAKADQGVVVTATVAYAAEGFETDIPAEAVFRLRTTAERRVADMRAFEAMLAATSLCTREDPRPANAHLPVCGSEAVFF